MLRILIADDHEVARRGIRAVLESHAGWEVCAEAKDGREAVDLAALAKPDVVLLDIGMPNLNGLEAATFAQAGTDRGGRLRDVDGNGVCEVIVSNEAQNQIFQWDRALRRWKAMDFALPKGTSIVNRDGQDNGLRFVDVNDDGHDDVIFSNEER